jgi:hypothetical protein
MLPLERYPPYWVAGPSSNAYIAQVSVRSHLGPMELFQRALGWITQSAVESLLVATGRANSRRAPHGGSGCKEQRGQFDEIRCTHCNNTFRPYADRRRRRRRNHGRRRRLKLPFSRASLGLIRDSVRTVWGWHGGALTMGSSLPVLMGN